MNRGHRTTDSCFCGRRPCSVTKRHPRAHRRGARYAIGGGGSHRGRSDRRLPDPPAGRHLDGPADAGHGRLEAIIAIRGEFPDARIIVLSTYSGDVQVVRALKAGARAYLLKGNVNKELLATIRAVHAGQKRVPPDVASALAEHAGEDGLSNREIEVLRLIAAGNANKEIAAQLGLAEDTVKRHVTNILSKLGANDRTHAVTMGLKRGIIELQ